MGFGNAKVVKKDEMRKRSIRGNTRDILDKALELPLEDCLMLDFNNDEQALSAANAVRHYIRYGKEKNRYEGMNVSQRRSTVFVYRKG